MSRSLNKVTLIGNLGSDPEIRSTPGGGRVAQFSLATSRTWNDQNGGKQEKTEWHRCVVWNSKGSQLADIVEKYVKKGDKLYLEGRIEYRQWQDKDGQTKYSTEINVRELILLGGGKRDGMDAEMDAGASSYGSGMGGGGGGNGGGNGGGGAPRRTAAPPARAKQPAAANTGGNDDFEDFPGALADDEDDLPF